MKTHRLFFWLQCCSLMVIMRPSGRVTFSCSQLQIFPHRSKSTSGYVCWCPCPTLPPVRCWNAENNCNSSSTWINLTKVLNWLDSSRVNIMLSPSERESKCVGICSPTSSIKELLLKYWMLLNSPISVDTFKFHCIPLLSLYFPNKWIWHNMSHWVRSALIQMTWGLLVTVERTEQIFSTRFRIK